MAAPATPQNFYVQQGNRVVQLDWDMTAGATSYTVQRSLDNITFTTVSSPITNSFQDNTVVVATKYYYKICANNGSGSSPYTNAQLVIPAPNGELSLYELRTRAQQRADRVNSQFVTTEEWNFFINESLKELYDLLVTVYEDMFSAPELSFTSNGTDYLYPLPDGLLTFTNAQGQSVVAPPFYKLAGVDLAINNVNNAFVTMDSYNLIDRNNFVYPNTSSTIYGVFNLRYRLMGNKIRFMPTPTAGQIIRLLYIPLLPTMLADNDITTIGYSGWLQYVIIRAAKYALDKEESDTSKLDDEIKFLKDRIEGTAPNRDAGRPQRIGDVTSQNIYGFNGPFPGFKGGF